MISKDKIYGVTYKKVFKKWIKMDGGCRGATFGTPGEVRGSHTDFGMGGTSPPHRGGAKGGDKGPMGENWRMIRDKIKGTKKISVNL